MTRDITAVDLELYPTGTNRLGQSGSVLFVVHLILGQLPCVCNILFIRDIRDIRFLYLSLIQHSHSKE